MGLKTYNPTSPGRRQLITTDRSELWNGKPVKTLTEGLSSKGGRNNRRPHHRLSIVAAGTSAPIAWSISGASSSTRSATVERLEYDPNRTAFIALVKYEDGEQAYIVAPQRLARRRQGRLLDADRRREAGQCHAARAHAGRHHRPQRRDEAPQGRPDRPFGRRLCPVCRPRPGLGDPSPQFGRAAPRARHLPRHRRRRLQPGPLATPRSARPAATAGSARSRSTAA